MSLTREEIFASRKDRKPLEMDVPEWGEKSIFIRVLSAEDQLTVFDGVAKRDFPILVLLHAVCDEHGKPIFDSTDAAELAKEDFPIIMRVFRVAARLNGFTNKELEEATESFAPAPDESSFSE